MIDVLNFIFVTDYLKDVKHILDRTDINDQQSKLQAFDKISARQVDFEQELRLRLNNKEA